MAETKMKNESLFSALRREKEQLEESEIRAETKLNKTSAAEKEDKNAATNSISELFKNEKAKKKNKHINRIATHLNDDEYNKFVKKCDEIGLSYSSVLRILANYFADNA